MNSSIGKKQEVNQQDLENKVKDMYKKVALFPEEKYHFEMGRALAERLGYPSSLLDKIPNKSIESFAGVGYYFDLANLQKEECVVDLGSGSGMDVFFAAQQVGAMGEVIGIDMTPEQLEKSKMLQQQDGYPQVVFRESYIEKLPILDNSIDAVISNGVVNLSSEKQQVFNEVERVLKHGGRLVLSDIVTTTQLPERITCNADLWAACIGGAILQAEYCELIKKTGMEIIKVKDNPYAFISNSAKGATGNYGIKSISILAVKR